MKDILSIAVTYVLTAFRERTTLFWFLVFPLFLLVILTMVFSGIGSTSIVSDVALVRDEPPQAGFDAAGLVEQAFRDLGGAGTSATPEAEQPQLFALSEPALGSDEPVAEILDTQRDLLRKGELDAIIVIPAGFNAELTERIAAGPDADQAAGIEIEVWVDAGRATSELASDVIGQVVATIDREIRIATGGYDPGAEPPVTYETVSPDEGRELKYVDFLLPGVVVMGFLTAGLFGVPGNILYGRDQGLLRRYWVTPLSVPRYLFGYTLGHLALCGIQATAIVALGKFGLGATVSLVQPATLLFLLLTACTFLAFGFLIASLARTANGGMAIANILNMPLMFLGGLFFSIGDVPIALRVIMLVNPVTYLAEGVRRVSGVEAGTVPWLAMLLVPGAWIVGSILIAAKRLSWDVER
ncbi:ABC transporter permease [Candidatus Bipolaricaulota bacterium]|nr:ABC transporter permease [Candidatus Bipolaricaulota bacterium]